MQTYIQKNLAIILLIIASILLQLFPFFTIILLLVLFYDMLQTIYGEKYIRITLSYHYKYDTTIYYHHMGFKITDNKYPTLHDIDKRLRKEIKNDSNLNAIQLFSYEELCQKSVVLISKIEKNDHLFQPI